MLIISNGAKCSTCKIQHNRCLFKSRRIEAAKYEDSQNMMCNGSTTVINDRFCAGW